MEDLVHITGLLYLVESIDSFSQRLPFAMVSYYVLMHANDKKILAS